MQRAQRDTSSSRRAQQAAALQQLAELRARKGGARQHPLKLRRKQQRGCQCAGSLQAAADLLEPAQRCAGRALPGVCLEDSDGGEDAQEQQPLASPRSSVLTAAPAAAQAGRAASSGSSPGRDGSHGAS